MILREMNKRNREHSFGEITRVPAV